MMGVHTEQKSLFTYSINLDQRVRKNNPLRQIAEHVDFSFVRDEVSSLYGNNGNESVDPEIILKMIFLLFLDNVQLEPLIDQHEANVDRPTSQQGAPWRSEPVESPASLHAAPRGFPPPPTRGGLSLRSSGAARQRTHCNSSAVKTENLSG